MRAVAAFTLALVPNLPGFVAKVNSNLDIPAGASYVLYAHLSSLFAAHVD